MINIDMDNKAEAASEKWFKYVNRVDSKLAPSQWESLLQSKAVSRWLGSNLESAQCKIFSHLTYLILAPIPLTTFR